MTKPAKRKPPKFRVGQLVMGKYGSILKIAHIDPDGTLYEWVFGEGGPISKISEVRPLTKEEMGR